MSVLSVSLSPEHTFTKSPQTSITLLKDVGVDGDAHRGVTVQHLSRTRAKPSAPNLRQVHLIQNETLEELGVKPAEVGENITTTGVDLLSLSTGTRIRFVPPAGREGNGAEHAVVCITGLRNPCHQIDKFRKGLQEKFIVRDVSRKIVGRKAGVMSVVEVGGIVEPGMQLEVEEPLQHESLECV